MLRLCLKEYKGMNRTRKVLVIRSGAMGDFIVTLPVIHLLRKRYSSWWLGIVARNRVRSLVNNVADEFLDIDGPLLVPFFQEEIDSNCDEYRYLAGFDLVISYLGARGKVSENLRALGKTRVINADALPPENYGRHITQFLLEPLAGVLDVSDTFSPPVPTVSIDEARARQAEKFLSACGIAPSSRVVAVHPGSGGRRKVSPARNFCRAVNWILARFRDAKVLVIQGEADQQDVFALERCLKTTAVRVRKENLLEVAAILSRASLFMGNDSGIAHLAAAVGAPSIVLFRASDPVLWAPGGENVWVATDSSLQEIVQAHAKMALEFS